MRRSWAARLAMAEEPGCGPATHHHEGSKAHLEDEEVQEEEDECPDEWTQLQAHDPAQAPLLAQQGALSLQAVALLSQVDPQEPARGDWSPTQWWSGTAGLPCQ